MLLLAEMAHALDDRAGALVLADRLAPYAGTHGVLGGLCAVLLGPVDRSRGLLARTLGRAEDATVLLDGAVHAARQAQEPLWAARAESADR